MSIDRKDHRVLGKISFPTDIAGMQPVPKKPAHIERAQMKLNKSLSMGKQKQANKTRILTPGFGWKRLSDG